MEQNIVDIIIEGKEKIDIFSLEDFIKKATLDNKNGKTAMAIKAVVENFDLTCIKARSVCGEGTKFLLAGIKRQASEKLKIHGVPFDKNKIFRAT